ETPVSAAETAGLASTKRCASSSGLSRPSSATVGSSCRARSTSAPYSPPAPSAPPGLPAIGWRTARWHAATAAKIRIALLHDPVVELEEVDRVAPEPAQARLERAADRAARVAQLLARHVDLGPDVDAGRPQLAQHPAQVLLGAAVAVRGRGVEIGDAPRHRPLDRPALVRRLAAHEQPADAAAAEADRRHPQAGSPKLSV